MDLLSAGVGGAVATAICSIFAWFIKRSVAQLDEKLRSHDMAIESQRTDLSNYKLHAEQHFVTSDELTKAIGNLEGTIERLIESVNSNANEMREWFRLLQQTKADK